MFIGFKNKTQLDSDFNKGDGLQSVFTFHQVREIRSFKISSMSLNALYGSKIKTQQFDYVLNVETDCSPSLLFIR